MAISKENKQFIDNLIDYYISEADSYRKIAEGYTPEIESVVDTAFGIIAGCVYSGFLQAYQNQQLTPNLEDVQEFNRILKDRAALIKKAIKNKKEEEEVLEPKKENSDDGKNVDDKD